MKTNENGRSMIEMLGVLAIIGVLSVGSIAGYQKAMMKYKMNKQAENFNMLLSNALQISGSLPKATKNGRIHYNNMLLKLNLLPDGIVYKNEPFSIKNSFPDQLEDIFGTQIGFYSQEGYGYEFAFSIKLANSSYGSDICKNIINITKEHSSNILRLIREDFTTGGANSSISIWSDCSQGTCFKNLSLNDIGNICKISDSTQNDRGHYAFSVLW